MARIKYTAIVESISGSLGGSTFQRNSYGHTIRTKARTVKRTNIAQVAARQRFTRAMQAWRGLTDAQRQLWLSWGKTFQSFTKHNPSSMRSGMDAFIRYHCYLFFSDSSVLTSPSFTLPDQDNGSVIIRNIAGVLYIDLNSDTEDGDWYDIVFLSRSLPASQLAVGGKTRYMLMGLNSVAGNNDITSYYTSVFGTIPSVGDRVGIKHVQIGVTAPVVRVAFEGYRTVVT